MNSEIRSGNVVSASNFNAKIAILLFDIYSTYLVLQ